MSEWPPAFFISDSAMRKAAPDIYRRLIAEHTELMLELYDNGLTVFEIATYLRDTMGVRPPTHAKDYETWLEHESIPGIRNSQIYCLYEMVEHVRRKHRKHQPKPKKSQQNIDWDRAYREARLEHAWLCRSEGKTFREIGERLGITKERARQCVLKFGRRVATAISRPHARFTIEESAP